MGIDRKTFWAVLLGLTISTVCWAQDPVLDWVVTDGDTSNDDATAVAVDAAGYVYSAGTFRGTVDLDPGPGTFEVSAPNIDVYVRKLDADGNFVWAGSYGTTGNNNSVNDIAVDEDENLYLTGSFGNTADFDPGAGTTELTSAGGADIYVLKLDSSGGLDWVRRMGGTTDDNGNAIAVDAAGNVYTTGDFTDTVDFDPGSGTTNLTSGGSLDAFVSKLDTDGDFVWAASNSGTSTVVGSAIQVDSSGNVYTCGRFNNTVDFDPGAGTNNIASNGSSDGYVQKLDAAGALVWMVQLGGNSSDTANDLAIDAANNLYTTGRHRGGVDFDPGAGTTSLTNAGSSDIYVQKMDTDGTFEWVVGMGGTDFEEGNGVSVDDAGNVYVAGHFADTVDFDPGVGTLGLTSAGGSDMFVLKLDTTGALTWARTFGDTGADVSFALAADDDDNVVVGGKFAGTVDFDPTAATQNTASAGGEDAVVLKLRSQFAPVANDDTGTTDEETVLSLVNGADASVLGNDTDENMGDTLTIDAADATSAQGATVTVNLDGTFTYDPTGAAALQALNDGDSVVDSFSYTVTDGLDTDTATVSITVNGVDEDTTPPDFANVTVAPAEALPGQDVTITFDVSEALLGDPTVTVDGDSATLLGVAKAGPTYTYGYAIPSGAAPGSPEIAISGVDLAGNPGSFTSTALLTIVNAVPLFAGPLLIILAIAGALMLRRRPV
jgi:VCBS repeat-containing protein